jgi:hypothetical protein
MPPLFHNDEPDGPSLVQASKQLREEAEAAAQRWLRANGLPDRYAEYLRNFLIQFVEDSVRR